MVKSSRNIKTISNLEVSEKMIMRDGGNVYSDSKKYLINEKKRSDEEIIQKVARFWDGDFDSIKTN